MSSMRRCKSCGTYYDTARFSRCCICGKEGGPVADGGREVPTGPPGEVMVIDDAALGVDAEAARDGKIAGWMIGLGVILGLVGPGLLSAVTRGSDGSALGLGFLIMLVVLAIYGAGAKSQGDPVRFAIGGVARTALATIGIAIAAGAVLAAGVVALAFVACMVSARGSGS